MCNSESSSESDKRRPFNRRRKPHHRRTRHLTKSSSASPPPLSSSSPQPLGSSSTCSCDHHLAVKQLHKSMETSSSLDHFAADVSCHHSVKPHAASKHHHLSPKKRRKALNQQRREVIPIFLHPFFLCIIALSIVSIACHLNSLTGKFVHDDLSAIVKNPDVQLYLHHHGGGVHRTSTSSERRITVLRSTHGPSR